MTSESKLNSQPQAESIYVLNRRIELLQPVQGFRTGLDSVMLAAACPAREGQNVLDLGCGVGGAGLCVLSRIDNTTLHGIDFQEECIDLAIQNAALNNMADRATFSPLSLLDYVRGIKGNKPVFDHVICNPPYMEAGTYLTSPTANKAVSHGQQDGTTLRDWVNAGLYALKPGGSFTIIHRADQTAAILQAMEARHFGQFEIIPLWPRTGHNAKRVIIRAYKNRKGGTAMHAGLVLHEADGRYTAQADAILRDGKALP